MIIYRRPVDKMLISLGLCFFITAPLCIYFFITHQNKAGYFTIVVLLTISMIKMTGLVIRPDVLRISGYYFFGLIRKERTFHKNENIAMSPLGADFGEDGEHFRVDDGDTGLGCLYSIYSVYRPPKVVKKEVEIQVRDGTGRIIKQVTVFINKKESGYLEAFMRSCNGCNEEIDG